MSMKIIPQPSATEKRGEGADDRLTWRNGAVERGNVKREIDREVTERGATKCTPFVKGKIPRSVGEKSVDAILNPFAEEILEIH